jgi:uncharacterized RDD family membrane protein YckC
LFGYTYAYSPHLGRVRWNELRDIALIQSTVVGLIGYWIYASVMESSAYQATVGKMARGLKVTDLNGNRISFPRALGRELVKCVTLFIVCAIAGFTARKQGLHDMIVGTLVQETGKPRVDWLSEGYSHIRDFLR